MDQGSAWLLRRLIGLLCRADGECVTNQGAQHHVVRKTRHFVRIAVFFFGNSVDITPQTSVEMTSVRLEQRPRISTQPRQQSSLVLWEIDRTGEYGRPHGDDG